MAWNGQSPDGLDFRGFSAWRASRKSEGGWLDAAEHNLYSSLPRSFPGRFEAIEPSVEAAAQYRCHVGELFVERWGLPDCEKARLSVCEGVRGALASLFAGLARSGLKALLPSDVYPVYLALAKEARLEFETYEARRGDGAWDEMDLEPFGAVLVCDPLKPWGGSMGGRMGGRLAAWASIDPSGRVAIVDSAYGIDASGWTRSALESGSAMVLASLSKGWLEPLAAGVALAPEAWADRARAWIGARAKNENRLRVAYHALARHADRPSEVERAIEQRRWAMSGTLAQRAGGGLDLTPAGYFWSSPMPSSWWAQRGILAIPASAFGSGEACSLVSMLEAVGSDARG